MAKNKLTVKTIQAAKSKEKPYKLWDGNGLHILIHPNGSKYFGHWKNGKRDGYGIYHFPKGES